MKTRFAGSISSYMKGQYEHELIAKLSHWKDLPEFGSKEDFAVAAITTESGDVYAEAVVVQGLKPKGPGHFARFKKPQSGFITVEWYRKKGV
jgi:hypothetical protein